MTVAVSLIIIRSVQIICCEVKNTNTEKENPFQPQYRENMDVNLWGIALVRNITGVSKLVV